MTDTPQGSDRGIDGIFEALADRRRRRVVCVLDRADGGVALSDLSERIAASDETVDDAAANGEEAASRRQVTTSLRQVHLPLLTEAGVAERSSDDVVRPGPAFDAALAILEAGRESLATNDATDRGR